MSEHAIPVSQRLQVARAYVRDPAVAPRLLRLFVEQPQQIGGSRTCPYRRSPDEGAEVLQISYLDGKALGDRDLALEQRIDARRREIPARLEAKRYEDAGVAREGIAARRFAAWERPTPAQEEWERGEHAALDAELKRLCAVVPCWEFNAAAWARGSTGGDVWRDTATGATVMGETLTLVVVYSLGVLERELLVERLRLAHSGTAPTVLLTESRKIPSALARRLEQMSVSALTLGPGYWAAVDAATPPAVALPVL